MSTTIHAPSRPAAPALDLGNAARTVSLVWRHGSPREAEFRLMGESLVAGLALS